jgi:cephalosporin-C deacetylase-like acetyl esterase
MIPYKTLCRVQKMSSSTITRNGKKHYHKSVRLFACFMLMSISVCLQCSAADWTTIGPSAADQELAEYFRNETAELRDECLADVKDLDDWKAKRPVYRRQLLEMLGLDPFPQKTDLKPVVTGTLDHNEFTVENVHFQSRPGLYVTANLYIPKNLEKPAPAILYVCGHGPVKKDGVSYGNKVGYQHHAAWFARHGYVCLVIDSLQLGEIEAIHHGTYRYKMWWWNSRGYSPAGVEAWNCIRALDYLETRKEVDKERFGVTGRSGGGAYSWWISAIDERIKAAVPVAGITDLQNHVVDGCVEGHCDCMYIVNTYRWDYPLVAALVAPRPLLISNTDKDSIFPLDGVSRTHEKVRRIYRLYDAEKNLGLNITEGPHKDTQELRIHAFVWFNRFLKNDESLIEKPAVPFFEPEQLKVFDKLPQDEINTKIHDSFVPKAPPPAIPESADDWNKQRTFWTQALREKAFRGWPSESQAGPLNVELVFSVERDGIRFSAYDFDSQPHVRLRLYIVRSQGSDKAQSVSLNVLDEKLWSRFLATMSVAFGSELADEKPGEPDPNTFGRIRKMISSDHRAIGFVAPRGIGHSAWNPDESKQTQIRRRFMLLGQTADGMRVWDVRRAIQALRSIDSQTETPLTLQGQNTMAGIALYASLFEPGVQTLNLWHPAYSHHEGPIFLNVLRYLDIPEAVAMAAERTEVQVYQEDNFDWAFPKAVAKKLGWPEKQFQQLVPQPGQDIFAAPDSPQVMRVGPDRKYKKPSEAARVVGDGAIVEIDAGIYEGDVCVWGQNDLTIRGVGGYAHLKANGASAQNKAIWVVKGRNATIEHIEFSGASVPDRNGAGIRIEGPGLTIRYCYFHDNEDGILGDSGESDILIEFTEFARNGHGDGYSHNMYIGHARSLTVRHCYSHHARTGHNLKSRAHENHILYNRIMDEADGTSSYAIDLPNGGRSFIIGNVIQQGPNTDNSTIVSYGAEGLSNPNSELYMVNNTIVNDRPTGTFVHIREGATAKLINNLFAGRGAPIKGQAEQTTNLATDTPGFVDRAKFDYRLTSESPAIDGGSKPGSVDTFNLRPLFQYVHPVSRRNRPSSGQIDIGAFEYQSN